MMSLLPFWTLNVSVALPFMEGQKALGFHPKIYLICVLKMNDGFSIGLWSDIKGVVDCDFTFLTLVSVQCCCLSINNICKVAALKVQCKRRYRLLKFWQFNAYKNGW